MTKEQMEQIVQANMQKIYLYCVRRLGNAAEAEDVASDITLELLRSYAGLKDDGAVYGYLWAVAGNLCRNYWRKARRRRTEELPENFAGTVQATPEDRVIRKEEISALRRELSLLGEKYRAVMIAYYIRRESCETIARQTGMSVTNVKQYLFEGRKKVREGMDMNRELGVYSYAPEKFTMNFWGDSGEGYWEIFERKLPGSIMLSVFDSPKTLEELSLEVGVAMPYLEDEVAKLEEYRLLVKKGRKYHCGIVIYDKTFTEKIHQAAQAAVRENIGGIRAAVEKGKKLLEETDYSCARDDENIRGWFILMLICWEALQESESRMKNPLTFPLLENGCRGYVMGMRGEIPSGISGIYGRYQLEHDYVRAFNFNLLTDRVFNPFAKGVRDVLLACEAGRGETADLERLSEMLGNGFVRVEDGAIRPDFPMISEKDYLSLAEKLKAEIGETAALAAGLRDAAAETLAEMMPGDLRNVREIGSIISMWSLMEDIIPVALEDGFLAKDGEGRNPTAFWFRT